MKQANIKIDKAKKIRLDKLKSALSQNEMIECKQELAKDPKPLRVFVSPNTTDFSGVVDTLKEKTKYRDLIDESINIPVRIMDNHFYKDTYAYMKQLKTLTFDRHNFNKTHKATIYLCNELVNALLDYDTHYTILKMNAFYHTLKKYIYCVKHTTLKTTNHYKVSRYIDLINFESIELINPSNYITDSINSKKTISNKKVHQSILLYPFQVALPTNKDTTFKKEMYEIETNYTIGIDFACDWLYYNTSNTILRMRIKHIITLTNAYTKLPFKDLLVLTFMRTLVFNNNETKTTILNTNYIALLETEIIDKQFSNIKDTNPTTPCFFRTMKHSKLVPSCVVPIITPKETKQRIKYSSKYKNVELTESVYTKDENFDKYVNHNCIKHKTSLAETDDEKIKIINEVLNETTDSIDKETLFYTISEDNKSYSFRNQVVSNYIKNLLDAKHLSPSEIDQLFNPKAKCEPQKITDTSNQVITIETTFKTESSSDEEDEEPPQDTLTYSENGVSHSPTSFNHKERSLRVCDASHFSLIFEYNKYYDFSNCKESIEQSFINKYNSSSKLKELCDDYSIIKVIKPINKTYTNQTYFNFILTTFNHSIISAQYHAYITDGVISSITQITNIL